MIFLVSVTAINGSLTHLVAMLSDRGMAAQDAASVLATAGIALVIGRVLCGYLLDRFHGRYVSCAFIVLPMVSIIGFGIGAKGLVLLACAVGLGMGIGGEMTCCPI